MTGIEMCDPTACAGPKSCGDDMCEIEQRRKRMGADPEPWVLHALDPNDDRTHRSAKRSAILWSTYEPRSVEDVGRLTDAREE